MKVAFTGSHGVGKTTACQNIKSLLENHGLEVELVKEVARQCPLLINEDTCIQAQTWILTHQVSEECLAEYEEPDVILSDRSIVDNLAYTETVIGRHCFSESIVNGWSQTYNHLIHLSPREEFLKDDGVRSVDKQFQEEIDNKVLELYDRFDVTDKVTHVEDIDEDINDIATTIVNEVQNSS